MAQHGLEPGAFIYVADAAYVTEDNLKKSRQRNLKVLSRLPASYSEYSKVIQALFCGIHTEHIDQFAGNGLENDYIQVVLGHQIPRLLQRVLGDM